jgi:chloramphenicol 3-O-phosphotransferase
MFVKAIEACILSPVSVQGIPCHERPGRRRTRDPCRLAGAARGEAQRAHRKRGDWADDIAGSHGGYREVRTPRPYTADLYVNK